jgi:hypothetical protein
MPVLFRRRTGRLWIVIREIWGDERSCRDGECPDEVGDDMGRWGRATESGSGSSVSTVPTARRLQRARIGDLRLWAGLALLVVSMAIGATLLSAGDDTVTVWRASRDLSAGSAPVDLEPVAVSRSVAGDRYVGSDVDAVGVLRWPVQAGELLPRAALTQPAAAATREVTIPVDPMHAPAGLQAGDIVDMWSTARDAASADTQVDAAPILVLPAVRVIALAGSDVGISGELGVVLEVRAEDVPAVVAASRAGVTDLVAVPLVSQQVLS